jgi:hypothetical protein
MNRAQHPSDGIMKLPLEDREEAERKKMSLSGTFDTLVEANMKLTSSVSNLVRVVYILVALDAVKMVYEVVK